MRPPADLPQECNSHNSHDLDSQATSYHLGQLKAKLAKLKRELLTPTSGGGGGGGLGFDVARTYVDLHSECIPGRDG